MGPLAEVAMRGGTPDSAEVRRYLDSVLVQANTPPSFGARDAANMVFLYLKTVPGTTRLAFANALRTSRDSAARELGEGAERLLTMNAQPLDLHGKTRDGSSFDLASMKGKVVVVDYMTSTCAPCIAALPKLKALYAAYHAAGLEITTIALDDSTQRPQVEALFAAHQLPWATVLTGGAGWEADAYVKRYQIRSVPFLFLIDRNGAVVQSGFVRDDESRAFIEQLMRPKP